jgi:hypothetical protein
MKTETQFFHKLLRRIPEYKNKFSILRSDISVAGNLIIFAADGSYDNQRPEWS